MMNLRRRHIGRPFGWRLDREVAPAQLEHGHSQAGRRRRREPEDRPHGDPGDSRRPAPCGRRSGDDGAAARRALGPRRQMTEHRTAPASHDGIVPCCARPGAATTRRVWNTPRDDVRVRRRR